MASWCYCRYTLMCETNERAQEVYDTICGWLSQDPPEGINWKNPWVGLFLIGSDTACWVGSAFEPKYPYGGAVGEAPTLEDNCIRFSVNWKWDNHDEVIADSITNAFPDVTILYSAAQDNNEYLLTNDESFVNQCEIDLWGWKEDEFWELASSITGKSVSQLESELNWVKEKDWYVSGDLDDVDMLARTLLKDLTDDNAAELNNVYEGFLKISVWEYQEIQRSSVFS